MRSKEELDAAWDKAIGLHCAGKLGEAEAIYRQMLASQPGLAQVVSWRWRNGSRAATPKRCPLSIGRWRSTPI